MFTDPSPVIPTAVICSDWDLRLVGRSTQSDGALEVCIQGSWKRLIFGKWDDKNADVTCKQLGFLGGGNLV